MCGSKMILDKYNNHKAIIDDILDNGNGLLMEQGLLNIRYYKLSSLTSGIKYFKDHNIYFNLPDISDNQFDNITCEEQMIEFIPGEYSQIHLLCFGEMGDFTETIKLLYKDGSIERIRAYFYNWTKILVGDVSDRLGDEGSSILVSKAQVTDNNTAFIYCNSIHVNILGRKLRGFTLPYNPYAHIIAVTLTK